MLCNSDVASGSVHMGFRRERQTTIYIRVKYPHLGVDFSLELVSFCYFWNPSTNPTKQRWLARSWERSQMHGSCVA